MKKTIDAQARTITFTFDQTSAPGTAPIVFHVDRAHADNVAYATLHGFAARIGDAAALVRDTKTGRSPSEAERFAEVLRMVEHYESGAERWTLREPGASRAKTLNPTILAIAQRKGITYEEAEARIAEQFLAELG